MDPGIQNLLTYPCLLCPGSQRLCRHQWPCLFSASLSESFCEHHKAHICSCSMLHSGANQCPCPKGKCSVFSPLTQGGSSVLILYSQTLLNLLLHCLWEHTYPQKCCKDILLNDSVMLCTALHKAQCLGAGMGDAQLPLQSERSVQPFSKAYSRCCVAGLLNHSVFPF